jgi:transcriptional regulator with XRE-family HTH domain
LDEENYKIKVSNIIRKQRDYFKLTQEQLAEKADISNQFLSDIENGKKSFTILNLNKLCRALYMSADRVVFGEENQTNVQQITDVLQTIDEKYLPLIEEHIKTFLKTISIKDE